MASIFEAKSNLKQLLLQNKDKLTNEVYKYLLSLIELEFAVTKDYLSKSGKEQIINTDIYYQVALYNIYHITDRILSSLDTVKFVSYDRNQHYDSFEMQGLYQSREYELCRLIRILYNFNDWKNISIINDYYLSCEGDVSSKTARDFAKKQALSSELHNKLLTEFALEDIQYNIVSPKQITTKKSILVETKLVRTIPKITFMHELHQEIYPKK